MNHIEITFDHDNDNIEVRQNDKLKFEQKLQKEKAWYASAYMAFMMEIVNLLWSSSDEHGNTDFENMHITIREQNDGSRRTVDEW